MSLLINISNDNLLTVDGVQDAIDGSFISGATVEANLKDENGVLVTGQSFPLLLTFVVGSNGKYIGTLEEALDLSVQTQYTLTIDIDADSGIRANFQIPVKALIRDAC